MGALPPHFPQPPFSPHFGAAFFFLIGTMGWDLSHWARSLPIVAPPFLPRKVSFRCNFLCAFLCPLFPCPERSPFGAIFFPLPPLVLWTLSLPRMVSFRCNVFALWVSWVCWGNPNGLDPRPEEAPRRGSFRGIFHLGHKVAFEMLIRGSIPILVTNP
jgi:hypothetical protein